MKKTDAEHPLYRESLAVARYFVENHYFVGPKEVATEPANILEECAVGKWPEWNLLKTQEAVYPDTLEKTLCQ